MRHTKIFISLGLFFLLLACSPMSVNAQIGDPADDPDLPIDGGVSLLVAAGVGYGIKKYKDERKKKQQPVDKG